MPNLKGAYTAIITPFDGRNALDEDGLRLLIKRQMESGINGLVFLGTTGEDPTLTKEEQQTILQIAKEESRGRTKVIVGTGSYSTRTTIEKTLQAAHYGADAALVITPYYNKPTQEGIVRHYEELTKATTLPILLYNNPTRTGINILPDTLKRLMEIPSVIGIKECSDSLSRISDIIEIGRQMRPEFAILSGDDNATLTLMTMGGHGVISAISNLIPSEIVNLVRALSESDFESAQWMHYKLMPLMRMVYSETNPIGIKAAMRLSDLPAGDCRLPLCGMSADNTVKLEKILASFCFPSGV